MTTYTPGQRVCIKAKGIYSGGGNYRAPAVPGSPYSHLVLLDDGILVAFHDSEVEPIETTEPGTRTVLIKGVAVPIIEAGPYGPHILLDDDTYVTAGMLEKLGFEVRS